MRHTCRPIGRLFCWILTGVLLTTLSTTGHAARTTRVNDTVYRADGLAAAGTLVISWPAFTSANNEAVAAGRMTVPIGANGAVDVALVPNTGSTPASFYTVIVKSNELKAHMSYLVGSGNEGKMQELEGRVQKHEAQLQRFGGIGAVFGVLLTLTHLAIDYFKVHRP
jgi:hypothetical protein